MTGLCESLSESPSSASPVSADKAPTDSVNVVIAGLAVVVAVAIDVVGVVGGVAIVVAIVATVAVTAVVTMVIDVVYIVPVFVPESNDLDWPVDGGL